MTRKKTFRPLGPYLLLIFLAAAAAGCSTSNESSQVGHLDPQGNSVAGWFVPFPGPSVHSRSATFDYINNGFDTGTSNCSECHGDALNGGIAKVSCQNIACHHNPIITGWANPAVHGAAAKRAPGSSSFFSCEICHGAGFPATGGASGFACQNCHPDHPHPEGWVPGGNLGGFTHVDTDQSNAPVCGRCHLNGANSPIPPEGTAPPGTPPGCFNNTLCHGPRQLLAAGTHAKGWMNVDNTAAFHGTFAPGPPTCTECHPIAGHPTCTTCHFDANGSRVSGAFNHVNAIATHGGAQVPVGNICENCHQTSRTFTADARPSCAAGPAVGPLPGPHPGNFTCHSDAVIDQTLTNPRF